MRRAARMPTPQMEFVPFSGGLDLVSTAIQAEPNRCRLSQNWEIDINNGYQPIKGYERYDGRDSPSSATYAIITITLTGTISVGDTITGVTSSATGVVISRPTGQVVITKLSGSFQNGETLNVGGVGQATTTSAATTNSATTSLLHAQYLNLAADEYRSDITTVTGSNDIIGLCHLNDVIYAFRPNAGNTAVDLYKSSSSGWVNVALGRELSFTSGGATEITEGQTITGATSAATAVVTRVVVESGTWGAGTAAGRFIFASQTGTFQAENIDVGASANLATIAGDSAAITLSTGGRFETENYSFGGATDRERIYGCDGVNRGFEFDGTVFVPIATGMTSDTPEHVTIHRNHLFFSFGGSVQHSSIADPYQWSVVTGAAELAIGAPVVGFERESGVDGSGALGIYSDNIIHMLYGSSSSDWSLMPFRQDAGAKAYSIQKLAQTLVLDDIGITSLSTTQAFGNFKHSALSSLVQDWVVQRRNKVKDSCVVRDKNQYRVFFSDKYALYCTFDGNKLMGMMPILLSHVVTCMIAFEASDGTERIFFGSDNGYVYQLDKGTSFDGDAIDTFMFLHFAHFGSPRVDKRFLDCTLEASGSGYAELNISYEIGYNETKIAQPGSQNKTTEFSSVFWDSFVWDSFIWDGSTLTVTECEMEGEGENVSLVIQSSSDYFSPVRLSGALYRYLPRRQLRV